MSSELADAGLRLDQAPPLSIPLRFFLSAPSFLLAAGLLLLWRGPSLVLSRYMLDTIAFTHLCTLGVLCMVMFGALYQMAPVVAASPVPRIGWSRAVHAALVLGTGALVAGLLLQSRAILVAAFAALGTAWLGFVLPVSIALWRSPAKSDATVQGMRLAVACLMVVGFLGVWMAHGHGGSHFPGPRPLFMAVHLGLGLLGWVGALITAVSFQVVPMFYLTPPLPERHKRGLLLCILVSCVLALTGLVARSCVPSFWTQRIDGALPLMFVPGALAVWVAMPALTLRALTLRKRKRADSSLRFWFTGLALGPATCLLAGLAIAMDDPRSELAFAWLALVGWALMISHGMLYRIVPFLVWFHRLSHLVGVVAVPSAAKLVSSRATERAFALHALVLALGLVAILLRSASLARVTGLVLAVLALQLGHTLIQLARYEPPKA